MKRTLPALPYAALALCLALGALVAAALSGGTTAAVLLRHSLPPLLVGMVCGLLGLARGWVPGGHRLRVDRARLLPGLLGLGLLATGITWVVLTYDPLDSRLPASMLFLAGADGPTAYVGLLLTGSLRLDGHEPTPPRRQALWWNLLAVLGVAALTAAMNGVLLALASANHPAASHAVSTALSALAAVLPVGLAWAFAHHDIRPALRPVDIVSAGLLLALACFLLLAVLAAKSPIGTFAGLLVRVPGLTPSILLLAGLLGPNLPSPPSPRQALRALGMARD